MSDSRDALAIKRWYGKQQSVHTLKTTYFKFLAKKQKQIMVNNSE